MSPLPAGQPLRLRIQLSKLGPARFLSHSEFSRTIMFAARRARLPLEYAGQFRSRIKISLSPPIPIGVTSECELIDFQLGGYISPADAQESLNGVFPDGIQVVNCRLMGADERPVGRLIDTARYLVTLPPEAGTSKAWEQAVDAFLASEAVEFERVQPRRTRMIDLRPGVHNLEVAPRREGEPVRLLMDLDDGTRGTVKPWEVIEVTARLAGVPGDAWRRAGVHRNGLFFRRGERLVSPMDIGRRRPAASRRGG